MPNDPLFSRSVDGAARGAQTPSEPSLAPGLVLAGKYRLVRPAGFGGMGVVWVARNEATNAEVAAKILLTAQTGVDAEAIARFRREAHAAAQLYHRGIVRIFDLVEMDIEDGAFVLRSHAGDGAQGEAGSLEDGDSSVRRATRKRVPDALVMVMELLRGETLAARMDTQRKFSLTETIEIALPLLSALAHAHAQGIVHRDMKPENVFLAVDPDAHVIPKILDFGISKLDQPTVPRITTDGAMLGTPNYMSPEQARGMLDIDARADVFASGIVIYEMLAGENPFTSGSYHSVIAAILERDPAPIRGLPEEVWRVLQRALEKPAALRYADAAELAAALKKSAQAAGVGTPDQSGGYPSRAGSLGDASVPPAPFREPELTIPSIYVREKRRARLKTWLGATFVAALLGGAAGVYSTSRMPAADARARSIAPPPPSAALPSSAEPAPPVAATAQPAAPPGEATVTIAPSSPDVPAPATSAPPHVHTAPPRAAATVHPKPSSAPPPADSATPKSSVVRDPGF